MPKTETVTIQDVMSELNKILSDWTGEDLAKLLNDTNDAAQYEYIGDGFFEVKTK